MAHAGTDVETAYRSPAHIANASAYGPSNVSPAGSV